MENKMNRHEDTIKSLDYYAGLWEKSLKDGVFDEAPHVEPPNTTTSFFGLGSQSKVTDEIRSSDAKYWNTLKGAADTTLSTQINEYQMNKAEMGSAAEKIARNPNPIGKNTLGKDFDPTNQAIDASWGPEDIVKLEELKFELHKIQDKINSLEGLSKSSESIRTKMESLKEKIDEFSDELNIPKSLQQGTV